MQAPPAAVLGNLVKHAERRAVPRLVAGAAGLFEAHRAAARAGERVAGGRGERHDRVVPGRLHMQPVRPLHVALVHARRGARTGVALARAKARKRREGHRGLERDALAGVLGRRLLRCLGTGRRRLRRRRRIRRLLCLPPHTVCEWTRRHPRCRGRAQGASQRGHTRCQQHAAWERRKAADGEEEDARTCLLGHVSRHLHTSTHDPRCILVTATTTGSRTRSPRASPPRRRSWP